MLTPMSNHYESGVSLDDSGRTAAQDYHETLWSGIEAWFIKLSEEGAAKGYGTPEQQPSDLFIQGMAYETTQKFHINYVPVQPVEIIRSAGDAAALAWSNRKPSRKAGHMIFISVYRLESGRYEFTGYNT
jgi:hypothetical protein